MKLYQYIPINQKLIVKHLLQSYIQQQNKEMVLKVYFHLFVVTIYCMHFISNGRIPKREEITQMNMKFVFFIV